MKNTPKQIYTQLKLKKPIEENNLNVIKNYFKTTEKVKEERIVGKNFRENITKEFEGAQNEFLNNFSQENSSNSKPNPETRIAMFETM